MPFAETFCIKCSCFVEQFDENALGVLEKLMKLR